MKRKKIADRVERRRKAWAAHFSGRTGFKAPGSNKKSFPKGTR